jgi:hypothetical protein
MDVKEPTLAEMINSVWKARAFILLGLITGWLVAGIIIVTAIPTYRAAMIIAPADGYALGDYASTVADGNRLEIPFWRPKDQEGVSTDFYRFTYTITAPSVAAILLKDQTVLSGIAKDKRWKGQGKDWSAEELAEYLEKNLRVEHLGTSPLRRISYTHPDTIFAADLLRKIHLVSDQLIRRDRRRQSENRIQYLQDSLHKTINPDHRKGIANLLMQQEHIRMLANLDEPYAAIMVEPPSTKPGPVWPNKSLLLSTFALIGAMLGYLFYSVRINAR